MAEENLEHEDVLLLLVVCSYLFSAHPLARQTENLSICSILLLRKKSATTTFSVTKIKKSYQLCCLAQLYFSFVLFLILNAGCSSYINNTLTNCNILLNHKNLVKVSISSLSGYLPSYVKNPWSHFSVSLGKYIFFLIPMGYSGM